MQTRKNRTPVGATPFISFIVPVYNVADSMLRECIESILALPMNDEQREVIVVDDGSDTPCINALSDLAGHLVYIRQKNAGLSAARNTGIRCATGQYLQFVDADDMLITRPYTFCVDAIFLRGADVIMFHLTDKADVPDGKTYAPETTGADYMLHNNLRASACGYLFRKDILGSLRFTPGILHEDEEFTPQLLLRAGTVVETDAQAYLYRKHEGTITTSNDPEQQRRRIDDTRTVIMRLNALTDSLPALEQQALKRRVAQLTMDFIYKIIMETGSMKVLKEQTDELRKQGLFPLPDKDYTKKYQWFRRMSSTTMGLRMLNRLLPLTRRKL